jgi:uncharacterized protein
MRRAIFEVTVAGTNISAALRPLLLGLSVTDNIGSNSDTATISLDDTGGQIILPKQGAAVSISLGWEGEGIREVFSGTVDEFRSSGSKSGGRTLSISAKGMDALGKAKEGQTRHFDGKSVGDILKAAGSHAGLGLIEVDPELAKISLPYIDMRAESFIGLGERLAALIGGRFRVQGGKAVMSRRAAGYKPSVTATAGVNLITWDLTPIISRARFKKAKAKSYDIKSAAEVVAEEDTGLDDDSAEATITRRDLMADDSEAKQAAKGDAAASLEASGGGSVLIDGNIDAIPGGKCVISGARPGIDGTYTVTSATHTYDSGGFTTMLQVGHPQSGAGSDKRRTADAATKTSTSGSGDAALDKILNS